MDDDRKKKIMLLLVGGMVALGVALMVLGSLLDSQEPATAPGPAEAPDPTAGQPGPARRSAPEEDAPPQAEPRTHRKQMAPGARARAIAPEVRRQMLAAILDKIAKRQAAHRATAKAADGQPEAGSLPKEYIRQQVQEIVPLIKECYEMALERSPDLGGSLKVRFTIAGDEEYGGLVTDSQVLEESTLAGNVDLTECVRETMYALRLKAPQGGGQVVVNYPFLFKSTSTEKPGD